MRKLHRNIAVLSLAWLLAVQVALLLNTPAFVRLYLAIFGPNHDPYFPIGQQLWEGWFCVVSFLVLLLLRKGSDF
jgi:hypothetical protein